MANAIRVEDFLQALSETKQTLQARHEIPEDGALAYSVMKELQKLYGITNDFEVMHQNSSSVDDNENNVQQRQLTRNERRKLKRVRSNMKEVLRAIGLELMLASFSTARSDYSPDLSRQYKISKQSTPFEMKIKFVDLEDGEKIGDTEWLKSVAGVVIQANHDPATSQTGSEDGVVKSWFRTSQQPEVLIPALGYMCISARDFNKLRSHKKSVKRIIPYDFSSTMMSSSHGQRRRNESEVLVPISQSDHRAKMSSLGLPSATARLHIARVNRNDRGTAMCSLRGVSIYNDNGVQVWKSRTAGSQESKLIRVVHPRVCVSARSNKYLIGANIGAEVTQAIKETTTSSTSVVNVNEEGDKSLLDTRGDEEGAYEEVDIDAEPEVAVPKASKRAELARLVQKEMEPLISIMKEELTTEYRLVDTKGSKIASDKDQGSVVDYTVKTKPVKSDVPAVAKRYHVTTFARCLTAIKVVHHANKMDTKGSYEPGHTLENWEYLAQHFREHDVALYDAIAKLYRNEACKFPSLYHLLTHTSGLPEYLPTDSKMAINHILTSTKDKPETKCLAAHLVSPDVYLCSPPGACHRPSNLGYAILGAYLVHVDGRKKKYEKEYNAMQQAKEDSEDPSETPEALEGGMLWMILEKCAKKLGMENATYQNTELHGDEEEDEEDEADKKSSPPSSKPKTNSSSLVASDTVRVPGNPGLFAADTGLYCTADDLAAFSAKVLNSSAKNELKAMIVARATVSPYVPLQYGFGGWKIDSLTCNPESMCILSDQEPMGHGYRVVLYPSRGVALTIVGNVPHHTPSYEFGASLHSRVLSSIRRVAPHSVIDPLIPAGKFAMLKSVRVPCIKDVPIGYVKMTKQYESSLKDETETVKCWNERQKFVSTYGGPEKVYYSITGSPVGRVESIRIFADAANDRTIVLVRNDQEANIRRASYKKSNGCFCVIDPIHRLPCEPIRITKINSPCDGTAIEIEGCVFVDAKTHRTMEESLRNYMNTMNLRIDESLIGVVGNSSSASRKGGISSPIGTNPNENVTTTSDNSNDPAVQKVGFGPVMAGLTIGVLTAAALSRRPYYYTAPAWGYPHYYNSHPYYNRGVYIMGNVNEHDRKVREHAPQIQAACKLDEQKYKTHDEFEIEKASRTQASIGKRGGGGGGGGGGRGHGGHHSKSNHYHNGGGGFRNRDYRGGPKFFGGGYGKYRPVSTDFYRNRAWPSSYYRPKYYPYDYSGAALYSLPWLLSNPYPTYSTVSPVWYNYDDPYYYNTI